MSMAENSTFIQAEPDNGTYISGICVSWLPHFTLFHFPSISNQFIQISTLDIIAGRRTKKTQSHCRSRPRSSKALDHLVIESSEYPHQAFCMSLGHIHSSVTCRSSWILYCASNIVERHQACAHPTDFIPRTLNHGVTSDHMLRYFSLEVGPV